MFAARGVDSRNADDAFRKLFHAVGNDVVADATGHGAGFVDAVPADENTEVNTVGVQIVDKCGQRNRWRLRVPEPFPRRTPADYLHVFADVWARPEIDDAR